MSRALELMEHEPSRGGLNRVGVTPVTGTERKDDLYKNPSEPGTQISLKYAYFPKASERQVARATSEG